MKLDEKFVKEMSKDGLTWAEAYQQITEIVERYGGTVEFDDGEYLFTIDGLSKYSREHIDNCNCEIQQVMEQLGMYVTNNPHEAARLRKAAQGR